MRRTRKSKVIVAALTLAILALGTFIGRHVLGNPRSVFDIPSNGVDIAVLSSDPTVAMGITVDVTPESWEIFIIPVPLTHEALPKKLTAALIVSQDWYLRVDSEYRQSIEKGFIAPWLFKPTDAQVIQVSVSDSTPGVFTLAPKNFYSRTFDGASLVIPSIGRPSTSCRYSYNHQCSRRKPYNGPIRAAGKSWYGSDRSYSTAEARVTLDLITPWSLISAFPDATETADALMSSNAPSWSGSRDTTRLVADVSSPATVSNSQVWLLAAGVLFGIGGGVVATWVTNWGQIPADTVAVSSGAGGVPGPQPEPDPQQTKVAAARKKARLRIFTFAGLAAVIGWHYFRRRTIRD